VALNQWRDADRRTRNSLYLIDHVGGKLKRLCGLF
jgi:hypothetical protein